MEEAAKDKATVSEEERRAIQEAAKAELPYTFTGGGLFLGQFRI